MLSRLLLSLAIAATACTAGSHDTAQPTTSECGAGADPECFNSGGFCITPSDTPDYGSVNESVLTAAFEDYDSRLGCQARMFVPCESGPYVIWAMHGEQPYLDEVSWTVVLDENTLEWVGELEPRAGTLQCSTWYRGDRDGLTCALEGVSRISEMLPTCNYYQHCDVCDCVANTVNDMLPAECDDELEPAGLR